MTKSLQPMVGYNNNVRYKGRTFHIQTEDSGARYARIVTHLFVDGGRIVKSTKTQYGDALEQDDLAETVRRIMKEQHKAMFLALRAGAYDKAIDRIVGGDQASDTPPPPSVELAAQMSDALASLVPMGEASRSVGAVVAADTRLPVLTDEPDVPAAQRPSSKPRRRSSAPPKRQRLVDDPTPVEMLPPTTPIDSVRPSERSQRVPQRPLTQQGEMLNPSSRSIFGGNSEATKTLDEVILSFLDEEER